MARGGPDWIHVVGRWVPVVEGKVDGELGNEEKKDIRPNSQNLL